MPDVQLTAGGLLMCYGDGESGPPMTRTIVERSIPTSRARGATRPAACAAALLAALAWSGPKAAEAQEADEADTTREDAATEEAGLPEEGETLADRIKAVERKVFLKRQRFEIHPYFALDLNDAFFQHFFVGAAAAYHLADSFSLELRGGASVAEIEKDSVRFVRVATDSLLEGAPSLVAHGDLNATWAPIYGKLSLFGESILHFDTFLTAGGGIFVTEREEREGPDAVLEEVTNVNPAFNVGVGQRYFINEWLVFRLEVRNYSYIETGDESDLQNVTMLGFAISGFFPTSFAYEYQ